MWYSDGVICVMTVLRARWSGFDLWKG